MNPIDIIKQLIAALKKALDTDRSDTPEVVRLKTENEQLMAKLKEEAGEDEEAQKFLAEVKPEIDDLLVRALAARPPLDPQIESVRNAKELTEPTVDSEDKPRPPADPVLAEMERKKAAAGGAPAPAQPQPTPPGNEPQAETGSGSPGQTNIGDSPVGGS